MKRILDACDRYPGNVESDESVRVDDEAFGLRIGDTIALKRERVKGNKLFLYTRKTGTPVYVPLPPAGGRGARPSWTSLTGTASISSPAGRRSRQTAARTGRGISITVFELAKVKDAHSHRFRDTFAVVAARE